MPDGPDPNELLTMKEIASLVKVTAKTVRRWLSEGRMPDPTFDDGAKVKRWKRCIIVAWMDAGGPRNPRPVRGKTAP